MSKYLIFIESNTTGTGMLALHRTRTLGYQPVLVTSRPQRYTGLDDAAPKVISCDTNDIGAVRAAIGGIDRGRIAGVTTTSEYYLPTVAELASALGLPGNPAQSVRICRNKAATRQALAAAGVAQPRFQVVRGAREAAEATRITGLPCVVKPVDDSGSQGVKSCSTAAEAAAHAAELLAVKANVRGQPSPGTVLVEELLDGPELSVEMFSEDGKAICKGISEKVLVGAPYFVEARHVFPATLPGQTAQTVIDLVTESLAATGIQRGPTHTEVRLTRSGPVVVEINARLAGGMIPELIRLTTGADLVTEQLLSALGEPVAPARVPTKYAGIQMLTASKAGVVTYVLGAQAAKALPGVTDVVVTAEPGQWVRPAVSAFERIGYVIATGADRDAVDEVLNRAVGLIRVPVRPMTSTVTVAEPVGAAAG